MSKDKRYTVFEARNARLKELFFGMTDEAVFTLIRRLKDSRPAALAKWRHEDFNEVRSVEFGLTDEQARSLIERLARLPTPAGWRIVREPREPGN